MAQTELLNYSTHLGSHNYGVEHKEHRGHLLSEPRQAVEGLELPFINFMARNQEGANQLIRQLNWLAVSYDIDGLDIASLLNAIDKSTGT